MVYIQYTLIFFKKNRSFTHNRIHKYLLIISFSLVLLPNKLVLKDLCSLKQNKTKWNLWWDSEHKQLLQEETWRSALGHKGAWASQGLEQLPGEAAVPSSCVMSYKAAAVAIMVRTSERPRKGLKRYWGCCDLNINMTVSLYPQVGQAWDNQVANVT